MDAPNVRAPEWGAEHATARFDAAEWIQSVCEIVVSKRRLDSAYFLAPDLEHLVEEVTPIEYADKKAESVIPFRPVPDGAADVRYRSLDRSGTAKWISAGSSDLPRADVAKAELSIRVETLGGAFGYTIDELAASAMGRQPLERDRSMACKEMLADGVEEALAMGNTNLGTRGLLNQEGASDPAELVSLTTGTWLTASSINIHKDINQVRRKMRLDTKSKHTPTHCGLPTELWSHLTGATWGTDNNDKTIMVVLRQNFPEITFFEWARLDTADAAGTGGRVVFSAYNPLNFWYGRARAFTMEAPQQKGLEYEIPAHERLTPGITVARAATIKYADNAI